MSCPSRRASRSARPVVTTIALAVVALAAHATGAISTDASTVLACGAAANQGLVIVDACAQSGDPPTIPAVAAPTALGSPPAAPASFDAGPGGSTLTLGGTSTMAGGTYDCTSLNVLKNALITFSGATTIRASTGASIQGRLRTTADDAPITILCGGSLSIGAVNSNNLGVSTAGARSDLTFQAAGSFQLFAAPYTPVVTATQSSLVVRATSISVSPNGLGAGIDVDVLASGDITMFGIIDSQYPDPQGGTVVSAGRDAALRSASGTVSIDGAQATVGGRLTVDAGANFLADHTNARITAGGGFDVFAHGGRIDVTNGARVTVGNPGATGASTWRARTAITVAGHSDNAFPAFGTTVTSGASTFVLECVEGDVDVGVAGATSPAAAIVASGAVEIRAAGRVRVLDASRVSATGGVTISAAGAASAATGATVESSAGEVVVESTTSVSAAAGSQITGTNVELRSQGTVSLLAGASAESTVGDLLIEGHSVVVSGAATARGALRIYGLGGLVDVRGATLSTRDSTSSTASGSIEVVAFAGPGAAILAQGATVRSGAGSKSGDVILRVVAPTNPGDPPPDDPPPGATTTRSDPPYVIPSSAVVKARRRSTAQDLRLSGFVDLGAGAAVTAGATTLSIAKVDLAASLSVSRSGAAVARGTDVLVTLGRPRPGSSRRALTIRARGAFFPSDLAGELTVRLALPGVTPTCRVDIEDGRFDVARGRLIAPALYVADVHSFRSGLVRVTLGTPNEFLSSTDPPDVVLAMGDERWNVGRDKFVADRHGRFAASPPTPGLARLSIDPRAHTIGADVTVQSLGLPTAGGPVEILLRVNSHTVRLLHVVLGTNRGLVVY